jgi:hypothetical protein
VLHARVESTTAPPGPPPRASTGISKFERIASRFIVPATTKSTGLRAVFDIEADGLLPDTTKLHCIVVADGPDTRHVGRNLLEQFEPFRGNFVIENHEPGVSAEDQSRARQGRQQCGQTVLYRSAECLLLAQSGHHNWAEECLLSGLPGRLAARPTISPAMWPERPVDAPFPGTGAPTYRLDPNRRMGEPHEGHRVDSGRRSDA